MLPTLLLALVPVLSADSDVSDPRIAAVENGLLPAVWIEGVPGWTLAERMAALNVPGVSVAVIHDSELAWAKGYGVKNAADGSPVTTSTLFQAASISKPVAAMGALRLVQEERMSLVDDIRDVLESWSLPDNRFSRENTLTLTHLLSHSGGVTVHGFAGYAKDEDRPSLIQVLNGEPPANSAPILLDSTPGDSFRYAGGGTSIMQQAVIDVTGMQFPAYLKASVLDPIGMTSSTYEQPLPDARHAEAAAGHLQDGLPTSGAWHIYPEMAAAGLWTTPTDLARFALEIQHSLQGLSNRVLSQEMTERMLTPVVQGGGPGGSIGLGLFLEDRKGGNTYFQHGGSNQGFKCQLYAHRDKGYGAVVMTNGDNGSRLASELLRSIAREYDWQGYLPDPLPTSEVSDLPLDQYVGRYEVGPDRIIVVARQGDGLSGSFAPERPSRLVPLGENRFLSLDNAATLRFEEPTEEGFEDLYVRVNQESLYGMRLGDEPLTAAELLVEGKLNQALDLYRELHAEDAEDPAVEDRKLRETASKLFATGRREAGLALALLNAEFHPESARACEALGEVQMRLDLRPDALRSYRRLIELLPSEPSLNKEMRAEYLAYARKMIARLERP